MYDLMAVVSAQSLKYPDRTIDDISGIVSVEDTMALVIFSTRIIRRLLALVEGHCGHRERTHI